jgi:hypothetical protein
VAAEGRTPGSEQAKEAKRLRGKEARRTRSHEELLSLLAS